MSRLPSIAALHAFEAAARLANLTRAAEELNLTQGAVSHRIRELESTLDTTLFVRKARGLELTEAGAAYLPYAREALERLRAGRDAIARRGRGSVLTVSLSPNFAAKWLVPRIGAFAASHPDIDLRIGAAARHVDFAVDDIDVAIRHGTGDWPHLHVTRLCSEEILPVAAPRLVPAPLSGASDLLGHTLLHDKERAAWRRWLAAFGVDAGSLEESERGPVFSDTHLAIDAAVAGQGIALARSALVALDLSAGRLIRPVAEALPASFSYWIVCPRPDVERPSIAAFRAWLLEQAAGSATPPPPASPRPT
jgi:LysR family glycine cleavage system transcriptional activator